MKFQVQAIFSSWGKRAFLLWMKSLRVERHSEFPEGPYVLGIWHQDLPLALYLFRKQKMTLFLSQSKDASLFARFLENLGYTLVRGSSSQGALNIRHVLKMLEKAPIGMALDGPRGPALIPKPGTSWLVEQSGKPFIFLEVKYSRFLRLNTWDRMILPLPFSKVKVRFYSGIPPLSEKSVARASYSTLLNSTAKESL